MNRTKGGGQKGGAMSTENLETLIREWIESINNAGQYIYKIELNLND